MEVILSFAIAFRHGVLDFENKSLANSVSEELQMETGWVINGKKVVGGRRHFSHRSFG